VGFFAKEEVGGVKGCFEGNCKQVGLQVIYVTHVDESCRTCE